ncbi:MAG: 6-phosphofructokinase [Gemmataceae bacterium]|nr:6-phosphofructokinase [Gemmataceae bacterium]
MSTLRGNAVVAQSGGPTAVINSSACGVIEEALRQRDAITGLLGANNGILGIVQEDLFDLGAESPDAITLLHATPSSAIGSCRYKLGDPDKDHEKYDRLLAVFAAHNIRYFFYIGGNDSMDTADKVNRLAAKRGYELRVVGIAKTIDNDLKGTDHCPGYGSVAKFLATCVMEAGRDTEAMYTFDPVSITEAMGRNTGWIAAATGLAKRHLDEAPNLIYVPEIAFDEKRFISDVMEVHRRLGRCFVVVSEGIKNAAGVYISDLARPDRPAVEKDMFGHQQLGGVAAYLAGIVKRETGLKARYNKLDTCQRNAVHFASKTDSDEAYECGQAAVRQALAGVTGKMVNLNRVSQQPYRSTPGLIDLAEVANGVRALPRDFMDSAGAGISEAMRAYAGPLIQGEVAIRIGHDGLPVFTRFQRRPIARQLPPFVGQQS